MADVLDERMVPVKEAARRIGVNPKTLYKAIKAGQVKGVQLGTAVRIPAAELRRLLAAKGS
jgi:excisionase family DNA binding protein